MKINSLSAAGRRQAYKCESAFTLPATMVNN